MFKCRNEVSILFSLALSSFNILTGYLYFPFFYFIFKLRGSQEPHLICIVVFVLAYFVIFLIVGKFFNLLGPDNVFFTNEICI